MKVMVMFLTVDICIFVLAGCLYQVSCIEYAVMPSNQTALLHDNVSLDCCLLGINGHTFVWQAFYDGVASQLIFERTLNNTSAVETPSKFSVRCGSGTADSLCCNLTIHDLLDEDFGQPISCYGYRFDWSEPGQERSPAVYISNGANVDHRPVLSGKMIGLVIAALISTVLIAAVAAYRLRRGCSENNEEHRVQGWEELETEDETL